jgi:pantoate--beta-alanine ligase
LRVARTIDALQLDRSKTIAFVPTMGAFHEGHLSLMRRAKQLGEIVVVSLFVNPTQFKAGEDFERYPRPEAKDFAMAEAHGVDVMFAPSPSEMYNHPQTTIHVAGVSELYDGVFRPGHFDGVTTVVAKLFNIVRPNVAIFGLKDLQQCAVIGKMVEDLNFSLILSMEETIREEGGLALSSRNAYLSLSERALAPALHRELTGLRVAGPAGLEGAKKRLTELGFRVEYLDIVDPFTMHPPESPATVRHAIVAAWLGKTRLIDNIKL